MPNLYTDCFQFYLQLALGVGAAFIRRFFSNLRKKYFKENYLK